MSRAAKALRLGLYLAAASVALTACGSTVRIAGEVERILCPEALVNLNLPARPLQPVWGADDLAALGTYSKRIESYADGLERQAGARVEQVINCREEK